MITFLFLWLLKIYVGKYEISPQNIFQNQQTKVLVTLLLRLSTQPKMHASAALSPSPSLFSHPTPKTTPFRSIDHRGSFYSTRRSLTAAASSRYSPMPEFNLYDLLGVESSCNRTQIKEAYRALQKRCHPDIAGPAGHDMAIVLNEAYALLSDPISRLTYDKELEKVADFHGYTGRPIYSVWFGPETEQRAVFVDEVKCVGCLKCALFASKTFAVESVYGRARVVAQWADPEHQIQEAIGACPVDCISIVDRSNLAALEFLMSKLPRGRVRVGVSNAASGARMSDVFNEMEKFQARYAKHKASSSKETDPCLASRLSAIQAIQMISNWLYWQTPGAGATSPIMQNSKTWARRQDAGPGVKRLKAAVEARKQVTTTAQPGEYWVPTAPVDVETTITDSGHKSAAKHSPTNNMKQTRNAMQSTSPVSPLPLGAAIVAAIVARLQLGQPVGVLEEHIGGSLALAIVNNSWTPVVLAAVTWYLITAYAVELVETLRQN